MTNYCRSCGGTGERLVRDSWGEEMGWSAFPVECDACAGSGRHVDVDRLVTVVTCLAIGAGLILVAVALFGGA